MKEDNNGKKPTVPILGRDKECNYSSIYNEQSESNL